MQEYHGAVIIESVWLSNRSNTYAAFATGTPPRVGLEGLEGVPEECTEYISRSLTHTAVFVPRNAP